ELRDTFAAFWCETMTPYFENTPENVNRWGELKKQLALRGAIVPDSPNSNTSFRTLIHGVLSAVTGRPVGWQFEKLIQVAHQLAQTHPENLLAFGYALRQNARETLLKSQDVSGKWERKSQEFRLRLKARDLTYMPNMEWLAALSFLFPGVGAAI